MVEQGKIGQKAKQGFYKKVGKDILVIDPETLEYREQKKVRFDSIGAVRGIERLDLESRLFFREKMQQQTSHGSVPRERCAIRHVF